MLLKEHSSSFKNRDHVNIINYNEKYVDCARAHASPEISTCEVPRDVSRKLQLTLCAGDNGIVEVSAYCMSDGETSI